MKRCLEFQSFGRLSVDVVPAHPVRERFLPVIQGDIGVEKRIVLVVGGRIS